jgi:hypothetical protein
MNSGRYVLSQILDLVDRKTLSRLVERYNAESRVRHFRGDREAAIEFRAGISDRARRMSGSARSLAAGD